jgi:hypothetical protein
VRGSISKMGICLVAVLSLTIAIGGIASADSGELLKLSQSKVKKIAKKQANKQIKKKAPKLSVLNAVNAENADTADSATTADTATNATNADNADVAANANNLGGQPPSFYARRLFARVDNTGGPATIVASSPGVTLGTPAEPFVGASRILFPVDMTNCAVTVTGVSGGTDIIARQSTTSSGANVVVVTANDAGATVKADYNIIGQC